MNKMPGNLISRLCYYIPIAVVIGIQILPLYVILLTSLKEPITLLYEKGAINFEGLSLANYSRVILKDQLWIPIKTSMIIGITSTGISVIVGSLAAYGLATFKFKGSWLISMGILCSRMVPPVALALPAFLLLRMFGAVDNYMGLILAHTTFNLPFAIWLMIPFFQMLPKDYSDAAALDGLGAWQTFSLIYFPLAKPGIVVAAIFCFLMSWNDFLYSLILAGSDTRTAPLAINAYMTSDQIEWGAMSAASMIVLIPVLIFCRYLQNHLIGGLTSGGVKG